ncbi:MAG: phosphoribosylformylglycinamidine cyclo-ligase, partial [Candidatus Omnitrophota bacterium]
AGVDVTGAERFVAEIKRLAKTSERPGCLGDIGTFGGFFELARNYKNPVLVSSCDGVGTKLKIAFLADIHHTVGIDLVAMNVDDCVCSGAEPLFFLDYIATGKLDKEKLVKIVQGVVAGCKSAGCALIGGETAEMPDFYQKGEYDLSGFCAAVVEKEKIIDGARAQTGDAVIGLASSGLHSNGFSLVRKVFSEKELKKRAGEFLVPTRIYAKSILALLAAFNNEARQTVKGIAHITGGAFFAKLPRIIPSGLAVGLCKNSWPIPPLFHEIKKRSALTPREMLGTLNMGIGMVVVASKNESENIIRFLRQEHDLPAWVIGEIIKGNREILL